MKFVKDKTLGYMYCYDPNHPSANGSGKIYEHVHVMEEHIGRRLNPDECVHHKDRNRGNNDIDNLQLMTRSDHTALHQKEDRKKEDRTASRVDSSCLVCGDLINDLEGRKRKFCSHKCSITALSRFEVTKEELERLVWEQPTTAVAKIFGVSDKAIEKRCKKLGILKPPRGYWMQKLAQEKREKSTSKIA